MIINKELAYSIDIPRKVMSSAKIQKIGGMTRKCTNLIPFPYYDGDAGTVKEMNGATFTVNADGSITINGTPTGTAYFRLSNGIEWATTSISADSVAKNADGKTFFNCRYNASNTLLTVNLSAGTTYTNTVVHPTINPGSTALPYEPYFEGLRSAKVTEVESVGVNIANCTVNKKVSGVTFGNIDGRCVLNGTAITVFSVDLVKVWCEAGTYTLGASGLNINGVDRVYIKNVSGTIAYGNTTAKVKISEAREYTISIVLNTGSAYSNKDIELFLYEGTTAQPYRPYVKHTLPIPEAVQSLEGYGLGVSDTIYNYIDWEKMQFVKRVGKKDMGTLNWKKGSLSGGHYRFLSTIPDIKRSVNAVAVGNILCDIADVISNSESYIGAYGIAVSHNSNQIFLSGAEYDGMSETSLKGAMSGVMLYYELAEPIVTDISDLITADNLIGVEGGGALTFENEYGYAVPSEVVFKEATLENYAERIVQNLKKIGTYLGVKNNPQSTSSILDGMDDSALKSTLISDSPAQSIHILSGRKAYVNGNLVVGEYDVESAIPDYYFDIRSSDAGPNDVKKGKYYFGVDSKGNLGGYYGNYVAPPLRNYRDIDVFYDEIIHVDIPDGTYGSPNNEYSSKVVIELPSTVLDTKTSNPVTSKAMLDGYIGYANGKSIVGSIPEVFKSDFEIELRPGEAIDVTIPYGYKESSETITLEGYYNDTELDSFLAALSNDIRNGKCAYANGKLVVGSVQIGTEIGITVNTLNEGGVDGLIEITVPDGIYDTQIKKTFADSDSLKIRNTAYKAHGDFAKSEHILRDMVAYANGEFLYGSIDTNGSDAVTTDVVNNKVVVNVSGGYYDDDMELELPDTIADVSGASEVNASEIPNGLVVYGLGKTKLEGLYTKYYANKVTGNADVFKSTDISMRPTLFDDGRYGMTLYDGFYSDARVILPSTNWVDTSAGDLYAITEDLIPSSYVGYVDGKKIIGSMTHNTDSSISIGISNNTTVSPTTVTVKVDVGKGFYEVGTSKSITLRSGIVDSSVLPDGKNYAYNGSLLEGYIAYANGSQIIGNMPFWRYGTGYSIEKNPDGKRVNYNISLGYHQGSGGIFDDEILYTGGQNGTLYAYSLEGEDGIFRSDYLVMGITACANGEVVHGSAEVFDTTDWLIQPKLLDDGRYGMELVDGFYSNVRAIMPNKNWVDTSSYDLYPITADIIPSSYVGFVDGKKIIGEMKVNAFDSESVFVKKTPTSRGTEISVDVNINPGFYDHHFDDVVTIPLENGICDVRNKDSQHIYATSEDLLYGSCAYSWDESTSTAKYITGSILKKYESDVAFITALSGKVTLKLPKGYYDSIEHELDTTVMETVAGNLSLDKVYTDQYNNTYYGSFKLPKGYTAFSNGNKVVGESQYKDNANISLDYGNRVIPDGFYRNVTFNLVNEDNLTLNWTLAITYETLLSTDSSYVIKLINEDGFGPYYFILNPNKLASEGPDLYTNVVELKGDEVLNPPVVGGIAEETIRGVLRPDFTSNNTFKITVCGLYGPYDDYYEPDPDGYKYYRYFYAKIGGI